MGPSPEPTPDQQPVSLFNTHPHQMQSSTRGRLATLNPTTAVTASPMRAGRHRATGRPVFCYEFQTITTFVVAAFQ